MPPPDVELGRAVQVICEKVRDVLMRNPYAWQVAAWESTCAGKDVIVIAGTGSGKSLVYQGMQYAKPGAIVLIVSPLLALMKDQVCLRRQRI
jgi:superfamily II DNA helicase RecQ